MNKRNNKLKKWLIVHSNQKLIMKNKIQKSIKKV